jgi:hypothetical protein
MDFPGDELADQLPAVTTIENIDPKATKRACKHGQRNQACGIEAGLFDANALSSHRHFRGEQSID